MFLVSVPGEQDVEKHLPVGTLLVTRRTGMLFTWSEREQIYKRSDFSVGSSFVYLGTLLPRLNVTFLTSKGLMGVNIGISTATTLKDKRLNWLDLQKAFSFDVIF